MRILTEKEAEDFLEKKGFDVVERTVIKNKKDISRIKFDFPWVMKISSKHIAHKSRIGGTLLGIKSLIEADGAFEKLMTIENNEGVMIQPMMDGKELIIGLKKTQEFGLVVMFGKGGTNVEEEKDISFRVTPLSEEDARNMIDELKISEIIKKQANEELIVKNLIKISGLAEKYPDIQELDINPMIINKNSAKVVDARISFD